MVAPSEIANLSRSLAQLCKLVRQALYVLQAEQDCLAASSGDAGEPQSSSALHAAPQQSPLQQRRQPVPQWILLRLQRPRRNNFLHRLRSDCGPQLPHSRPADWDRAMHRCPRKGPCLRSRVLWLLIAPTAGRLSRKQPSLWTSYID